MVRSAPRADEQNGVFPGGAISDLPAEEGTPEPGYRSGVGAVDQITKNARHDHFRVWRKRRLRQVERQYGDRLDEVADFLAEFAAQVKAVGPKTYLESMAHRKVRRSRALETEPED